MGEITQANSCRRAYRISLAFEKVNELVLKTRAVSASHANAAAAKERKE